MFEQSVSLWLWLSCSPLSCLVFLSHLDVKIMAAMLEQSVSLWLSCSVYHVLYYCLMWTSRLASQWLSSLSHCCCLAPLCHVLYFCLLWTSRPRPQSWEQFTSSWAACFCLSCVSVSHGCQDQSHHVGGSLPHPECLVPFYRVSISRGHEDLCSLLRSAVSFQISCLHPFILSCVFVKLGSVFFKVSFLLCLISCPVFLSDFTIKMSIFSTLLPQHGIMWVYNDQC